MKKETKHVVSGPSAMVQKELASLAAQSCACACSCGSESGSGTGGGSSSGGLLDILSF